MKKRILSVFLVITILSVMCTIPVSAAVPGSGEIVPQYETVICPGCYASVRVRVTTTSRYIVEPACELGGAMAHNHEYITTSRIAVCPNCGELPVGGSTAKYCQGIKIRYDQG